jgi:hypothetical protein
MHLIPKHVSYWLHRETSIMQAKAHNCTDQSCGHCTFLRFGGMPHVAEVVNAPPMSEF